MADVKHGTSKRADKERKKEGIWNKEIFLSTALREIMDQWSQVTPENICFAASVYYPIADIDLVFDERTFEDFDSIEYDVLQFIAELGADIELLARTTGLSVTYVNKMMQLLHGYGHIDAAGRITETGRQSLAEGKKVTCTQVSQKVQMDALFLRLLKVDEAIREEDLYERGHTEHRVGIIPCVQGVSRTIIKDQVKSIDLKRLIALDKSVLNANVEHIRSIECAGVRYVKSVMLCLKKETSDLGVAPDLPVVFGKRLVPKKGQHSLSTVWMPFSIPNHQMSVLFGQLNERADISLSLEMLSGGVSKTTFDAGNDKIRALCENVLKEQQESSCTYWEDKIPKKCDGREKSRAQYEKKLNGIFDLSAASVTLVPYKQAYISMTVDFSAESIVRYNRELLDWLFSIGRRGGVVLSSDYWYGGFVRLKSDDPRIKELAERIADCIWARGFRFMQGHLAQEFSPRWRRQGEEPEDAVEEELQGSIYERMVAALDEARLEQYDRAMNG